MAAKFTTESTYKTLMSDEVLDWLEKYGTEEDRKGFKDALLKDKDGNTLEKGNWMNAKLWFCKKFAPELVPTPKAKKKTLAERVANW